MNCNVLFQGTVSSVYSIVPTDVVVKIGGVYDKEQVAADKFPGINVPKVIRSGPNWCIQERIDETGTPTRDELLSLLNDFKQYTGNPGYWWADRNPRHCESWKDYLVCTVPNSYQSIYDTFQSQLCNVPTENNTLVHGDFKLRNLLKADKIYVIDWEASLYGDSMYDVAFMEFYSDVVLFDSYPQRLAYLSVIALRALGFFGVREDILTRYAQLSKINR